MDLARKYLKRHDKLVEVVADYEREIGRPCPGQRAVYQDYYERAKVILALAVLTEGANDER